MAYRICAHLKQGGDRCGSPALRGATLCHNHYRFCKRHKTLTVSSKGAMPREVEPQQNQTTCDLESFGLLDSRQAILRATGFVMRELASNRMKIKVASTLLFGLQTATMNLRRSD